MFHIEIPENSAGNKTIAALCYKMISQKNANCSKIDLENSAEYEQN